MNKIEFNSRIRISIALVFIIFISCAPVDTNEDIGKYLTDLPFKMEK